MRGGCLGLAVLAVSCTPSPATGDAAEGSTGASPTTTPDASTGLASTGSAPTRDTMATSPQADSTTGDTGSDTTTTTGAPPDDPLLPPLPPGTFTDVTTEAGIEAPHDPGGNITGQAWGDYDRDGWLDLFLTGGDGPNQLWHNLGDGTFEAIAIPEAVVMPGVAKAGATWADYDNDGWLDLYVCVLGPNVLLRNELGRGGPALVPVAVGVEHPGHGRAAAWGDYDRDGRLDLYLVNGGDEADVLYHAQPDDSFVDVTTLVPLPAGKPAYAATWVDYDDDADLDLYVVSDHHAGNDLWRNDGPDPDPMAGPDAWLFTNVSVTSGAGLEVDAMGIAVGDYDEDGDLDLFFSDILGTNLLRNDLELGTPSFTEVAAEAGVDHASVNWGAVWLDHDHDGWLDLYLATQNSSPPLLTNRLFTNLGDGTFADASKGCGCADPAFSTGVAAADYDRDGDVDLVVGNYGTGYRLLRNDDGPAPGRHWLVVELVGAAPIDRDALGAKVTVHTTDGRHRVAERRSGSSLGSGDMLPLHFGLGSAQVASVTIRWPDGSIDERTEVPTDAYWVATYAQ